MTTTMDTNSYRATFPKTIGTLDITTCATGKLTYNTLTGCSKLSTAGANGSEYTHLGAFPMVGTSATQVTLLYSPDGTACAGPIASTTLSAFATTTAGTLQTAAFLNADGTQISESSPLRLPANGQLWVQIGATQTAPGVAVVAQRRDL